MMRSNRSHEEDQPSPLLHRAPENDSASRSLLAAYWHSIDENDVLKHVTLETVRNSHSNAFFGNQKKSRIKIHSHRALIQFSKFL